MHTVSTTNVSYQMSRLRRLALLCGVVGAYLLVGGCSGAHDLDVHNELNFDITLFSRCEYPGCTLPDIVFGTVPAHTTVHFP